MTAFEIVRLGALDLDRAARLHGESFGTMGEVPWTRQDLAGLMASPGVAGFLLRAGDEDAGLALCRVAADEAELLTIAVRPAWRRRGGARQLLAAVVDWVREAGATTLFLEVGADNPGAQRLYEAQGFAIAGRRKAYYRRGALPPADAVVMHRALG
jgi:ribosomal-protein-alanine N-acetyltransferase